MTFTTHSFMYHLLESTVSLAIHICMYKVFYLSFPLSREINIWISVMHGGKILLNTSVLYALWSQRNQNVGVEAEKGLVQDHARRQVACTPRIPSPWKIAAKQLRQREGGAWLVMTSSGCWNPWFLWLSVLVRSWCTCELHQDKCQSLFCNFLISVWMDF